jgi:dihydrolipoamide dehydrogenase
MVVGDVTTGTELLVVGGGVGGYSAAIRAAQHDVDVTLVERGAFGGTCLNYGCIPSKAYITATGMAHRVGHAEEMGIHADPAVDLAGMREWKDGVVTQLTDGIRKLTEGNGVTVVDGTATFVDDHRARIAHSGEGQGSETVEFEYAVVATGSRPMAIPGFEFDGEHILTSRDLLELDSVPDRLVVIGGGYIGMELSMVFAKLGTEVTVVEMLPDILEGYGRRITRLVKQNAESLGIEFGFEERAADWTTDGDDVVVTTETEDGEESTYRADRVLLAVGREPVTDTVDLENVGLEPNEHGFIETDDQARTAVDHVFAVGDVAGEPLLAHAAGKEGIVAAEVVAGEPAALDYQAMPAAVFTDPEIATVGMTKDEAADAGFDPVVGQMSFRASGRALTTGEADGFVRIVADEESGFVLGGQIVGPEASELVAEVALAIEVGATLEDVGSTVHTHPTLAEAVMEAAENAQGQAIHTLNR